MKPNPFARPLVLGAIASAVLVACGGGGGGGDNEDPVQITTLSNRADLVSDGDVLVEIVLPAGASGAGLKVEVGGRDVTSAFVTSNGRTRGVVTGLAVGTNVITADADGAAAATLTVTNAGRGGSILSGPQTVPFYCATVTPQPASGLMPATNQSGLGTAATDAQCNIATEYKLYYRTTTAGCSFAIPDPSPSVPFASTMPPTSAPPPANPCFKTYDPAAPLPADMATTSTDAGVAVNYIVRVERGTMNRGIYDIAVLFDPTRPAWTATAPQPQWNGKVYFQFGASTGQPRRQVRPAPAWTNDATLSRGFMVVQNSMTDSATNSNRVSMTETVMMMKERIADAYGAIRYTLGTGCSGGSINSNQNASIAPGQLDGIVISCAFPDSETTAIEVGDCVQLVEAYQRPQWLALMTTAGYTQAEINARKAAINGHPDQTGCHGWFNAFGSNAKAGNYMQRFVASQTTGAISTIATPTNNCQLPIAAVYDPVANPAGPRCNAWSWAESIWGRVSGTVFANDTRDNVGIQYGLNALLGGSITAEEFVTLNEIAGGADRDTNPTTARTVADAAALPIAYRSGIVTSGKNLAKTAVLDLRGWDDSALLTPPGLSAPPAFPIHYVWRSFSIRDRLDKETGNHNNQVIWRFGRFGLLPTPAVSLEALLAMDQWLTALKADASSNAIEAKLTAAKPATAFDFCYLSTDVAQSTKVTDKPTCDADTFLKPSSSPRQVAGGPLTENILKCQLKPIAFSDYGSVVFNAAQQTRLQAVFPGGVCDWTKPGVGQQDAAAPLTFAAAPGGTPLPAAPVSARK